MDVNSNSDQYVLEEFDEKCLSSDFVFWLWYLGRS